MKKAYLLLLVALPLILSSDFEVPDLDYNNEDPTCSNVNVLIAATDADITRLTNYITSTLPKRRSLLENIKDSSKKTCQIVSRKRPSMLQMSSSSAKARVASVNTLEKLNNQVNHIADSLFEQKSNNKQDSSLVLLKSFDTDSNDLCNSISDTATKLIKYINFLIPAIRSEYIEGILSDRQNTLQAFSEKCSDPACGKDSDHEDEDEDEVEDEEETAIETDHEDEDEVEEETAIETHPCNSDGYTFYPGLDSTGSNIVENENVGTEELQASCSQEPSCLAFNTDGALKYELQPKSLWNHLSDEAGKGICVKNNATIPVATDPSSVNWIFFPRLDSEGSDFINLEGWSVEQLKDYCGSNPNCNAVNTNGDAKHGVQSYRINWKTISNNTEEGIYVKESALENVDFSLEGYTYYPGSDSFGGDYIQIENGTLEEIKEQCDANTTCLAFNTNGWLKFQIQPKSLWTEWSNGAGQGFYIKNSATVPNATDSSSVKWVFYPQLDSQGGEIGYLQNLTVEELQDYCGSNPNCEAFTTNGHAKYQLQAKRNWVNWTNDAKQGIYVKKSVLSTVDYNIDGYTFYPGVDSVGGEISLLQDADTTALKAQCDANSKCLAFNTNGSSKFQIQPKSLWTETSDDPSQGFYVKTASVIPASTDANSVKWVFIPYQDSEGGNINSVSGQTVDQLKQYCGSNPNCVAFTSNGNYKYQLKSRYSWTNWTTDSTKGIYVKSEILQTLDYNMTGYTFYQGMDENMCNLLQVVSSDLTVVKKACDSDSTCIGFNTNGWLKNVTLPKVDWSQVSTDPSQGFYLKASTTIPPAVTADSIKWVFYQGLDSVSYQIANLTGYTVDQLKLYCANHPQCLGFSTSGSLKYQLLSKLNWTTWTTNSSQGIWVKESAPVNYNIEGYTFYQGYDEMGCDLSSTGSSNTFTNKQKCDADKNCLGFNTAGGLKKIILPKNIWSQSSSSDVSKGFYIKNTSSIPAAKGANSVSWSQIFKADSSGNDIGQLPGYNVDQLKYFCANHPQCAGFNTQGWVKYEIKDFWHRTFSWSIDTYSKN